MTRAKKVVVSVSEETIQAALQYYPAEVSIRKAAKLHEMTNREKVRGQVIEEEGDGVAAKAIAS